MVLSATVLSAKVYRFKIKQEGTVYSVVSPLDAAIEYWCKGYSGGLQPIDAATEHW